MAHPLHRFCCEDFTFNGAKATPKTLTNKQSDSTSKMETQATPNRSAESHEEMAAFAKALAHPTRLKILRLLSNQSCCFTGDFVEILPIAQSTISQHLKELKNVGLIQGEINPPKTKYCINPANWDKAKRLFADFFQSES